MRRWIVGVALALVVIAVLAVSGYYVVNSRSFQLAGRLVERVDTTKRIVALTLDDGPGAMTPDVLRILADANVRATFYLMGQDLAAHPEFGRAIAAAGHEIGNHTYTHRRMVFVSPETVASEVERTDDEIRMTGYQGRITFRPPCGKKLWTLPKYLSDHDRTTVTWDVGVDTAAGATADQITAETVDAVRPGSIILLHVMYRSWAASLAALPRIIAELHADGYRFVTVSDLISR